MSVARQTVGLLVLLAICYAAAAIGSAWTMPSIPTWYAGLAKPPWTPPNWVFGPVWSVLYTLMAVAAWLVWRRGGLAAQRVPLALFAIQLVLNIGWSAVFFSQHLPAAGLAVIVLLWLAILATALAFRRVTPLAAWLLVPYVLWVAYAITLNYGILVRNPGVTT